MRRLALALPAVLAACAAHSASVTTTVADGDRLPVRLAVLPPTGGNLPTEFAAMLRTQLGNALELRGYVKLDDAWIDQRLTLVGYQPWQRDWAPVDERLAMFGVANDVDGVVLIEGFEVSALVSGIYNEHTLRGRMRVLDAHQGRSPWTFDIGASNIGGVLLQSGQVFDAIGDTIDADAQRRFAGLASELALAAAQRVPINPEPVPIGSRPQVASVNAARGAAADAVAVEVTGSARCRAFASLPGCLGRYPLAEVAPGRYAGTLPLPHAASEVIAVLRDRIGASSVPMRAPLAEVVGQ